MAAALQYVPLSFGPLATKCSVRRNNTGGAVKVRAMCFGSHASGLQSEATVQKMLVIDNPALGHSRDSSVEKHLFKKLVDVELINDSQLEEFKRMLTRTVADICDANADLLTNGDIRVLPPIFKMYGRQRSFFGSVVTLALHEDSNGLVWDTLLEKGEGRVLLIDGGGSMRCALLGGILTALASKNGWEGVVVNGCIRDVDEINSCNIGVRALASNPKRPKKNRQGEKHVTVTIGTTVVRDGEWLYADNDGIIVTKTEIPHQV